MYKSKIRIDDNLLNKIVSSSELTNSDKINFMKYMSYMTISEKRELVETI